MAGCDVEVSRIYILSLTEDEATQLASLLQNAPEGWIETEKMENIRKSIWSALTNPLIKNNVLRGS